MRESLPNVQLTQGSHGAGKLKSPKKFIGKVSFLRPQTYTIIKVSEDPRKKTELNGAMQSIRPAPKRTIVRKSADLPRNDGPSSNSRQYLTLLICVRVIYSCARMQIKQIIRKISSRHAPAEIHSTLQMTKSTAPTGDIAST